MQPGFKHHFLVAMPQLDDPHFGQTVTWVLEHNDEGAFGLTINRPTDLLFQEIAGNLDMRCTGNGPFPPVLWGGPVHREMGFILHRDDGRRWNNTHPVPGDILLTTSRDIIQSLAEGTGPEQAVLMLGYCAWGPGQLEQEMLDNSWLSVPALPDLVFDVPLEDRWLQAGQQLGVDIRLMTLPAGHA